MSRSSTAPSRPWNVVQTGRAERDGLAVHRAAGGHDEVGEGDQRLRVDRALGDDEAAAAQLRALLRRARQDDGLRAAQALEHRAEHVVLEAVIERHAGGVRTTAIGSAGSRPSSARTAASGSKSAR